MTPSTIAPQAAAESANTACSAASWCTAHSETAPGVLVHLSDFDVTPTGLVIALKLRTRRDGEHVPDDISVLIFTPLPGTPATPEAWRLAWLRSAANAA